MSVIRTVRSRSKRRSFCFKLAPRQVYLVNYHHFGYCLPSVKTLDEIWHVPLPATQVTNLGRWEAV